MNFTFNLNTLLPLSSLIISLFLAIVALRYSSKRLLAIFIALMLAISWWSLASILENAGLALSTKIFWLRMTYLSIVSIPIIWLMFTVQYSGGRKWLTRRTVAILTILPVITLAIVWTNNMHHLMWTDIWLNTSVSPAVDAVTHGAWFWIHSAYSYGLLLVGLLYLVRAYQKSDGIYRKQAGLLIAAALVPWVGNFLFIAGIGPFALVDPTPLAFAITGAAFLFGLSRLQLLDLMPIARDEIFRSMVDGVIVIDDHQRIVDINPAAQSIIGTGRSSAIGRPYDLVMPDPARSIEFKADMGSSQVEIPIGDGEGQRYYRMTISPIQMGSSINGHLIVLNDDTDRRKAEVDSRERMRLQAEVFEREKFAEVIQHRLDFEQTIARLSSRFVGLYDIDKAINASLKDLQELSKVNRVYLFLFRESSIDIKGANEWCIAKVDTRIDYLKDLIQDKNSWWMTKLGKKEFINVNDVSKMPIEASAENIILRNCGIKSTLVFPVFVKETLAGFIGFDSLNNRDDWNDNDLAALRMSSEICSNALDRQLASDRLAELIEELRSFNLQLEAKVEERTKQLAEALAGTKASSQAKSEFLASMSHELRTPLNAIIGFCQILHERYFGDLNEKQAEYISDIMDSGKHLLSLINDILDLSKIEAGKMEFEMSPVNLAELVNRSLVMVKEKALAHNIDLNVHVSDIEGMEIKGDERRLKQVMFNLLSNATKFTPDGGNITVDAKKDGGELVISVTDTGIGITPAEKKHMFEAFYQASGGLKDKTPGTGLGLPITRDIVEKHGGRIWVESEGQNRGSRFTFTLPTLEQ